MGLLTNPKTRERISGLISRYDNKLCVLCYIGGLAYFLALAYRPMNAGTYFSENALLPGLVEADFYSDHGAGNYFRDLKDEIKKLKEHKDTHHRIPTHWFEEKFRDLGLDTYVQNYTFKYPEDLLKGQAFPGQNVYGILRAPRTASTEAVVLSAPYVPPESPTDKTYAGLALMLGLAKAFRKHTYWAKDIIFLVTEHENIGMQAWLNAYHYSNNEYIMSGELHGRSGSIQAAVNLEMATDSISRVNIKMEGLNGQLPNLDLINTAVRLCRREKIPPTLQKRVDPMKPESREGFEHMLKTMLLMMWRQTPGVPSGTHGLFHRYHIEAITLQGVKLKNAKRTFGFSEVGRVMEGVFRSLNNLLERFHQSFFFYLLPSTDRYVSIGLFMPPFGVLIAPILIKAIALWISYGIQCEEKRERADEAQGDEQEHDETAKGDEKQPAGDESSPSTVTDEEESSFGTLLSLAPVCVMAYMFGLGTLYCPSYFIKLSKALHTTPQEGLTFGLCAIQLAAIIHPVILKRKISKRGDQGPDWRLLKCIALLVLGVVLGATSVMNISLAFFLAAAWAPVMVFVRPTSSRLGRWVQYVVLLLVSPMSLFAIACVVHRVIQAGLPSDDLGAFALQTWEAAQTGLLYAVVDRFFYGNWMYSFVSLAVLPNWCLFWALLWACKAES